MDATGTYDLGNLSGLSVLPFDTAEYSNKGEGFINDLATGECTALIEKILELPVNKNGDSILPAKIMKLPRSQKVPGETPLTRWEKFAKSKGIVKKKRDRKVWDKVHREWRPRWGYKRANDPDEKDWVIEDNSGERYAPGEDPFLLRSRKKKEVMRKQRKRQARNVLEGADVPIPSKSMNNATSREKEKEDITQAYQILRGNTASMGKFDTKRSLETDADIRTTRRKEKKVEAVIGDFKKEKSELGNIVDNIINRRSKRSFSGQGARPSSERGGKKRKR